MLNVCEDELVCDLAETYHIFNWQESNWKETHDGSRRTLLRLGPRDNRLPDLRAARPLRKGEVDDLHALGAKIALVAVEALGLLVVATDEELVVVWVSEWGFFQTRAAFNGNAVLIDIAQRPHRHAQAASDVVARRPAERPKPRRIHHRAIRRREARPLHGVGELEADLDTTDRSYDSRKVAERDVRFGVGDVVGDPILPFEEHPEESRHRICHMQIREDLLALALENHILARQRVVDELGEGLGVGGQ